MDPGAFIIGGGLSDAADLLLDPIRTAFEDALTGRGHRPLPDIRIAELGSAAGIVGAADLARVRPFRDVIVQAWPPSAC